MLRALKVAVRFFGRLLRVRPRVAKLRKLDVPERWEESFKVVQYVGSRTLDDTGGRVVYHGLENIPEEGSFYLVANHQCYFDICALVRVMDRPLAFIAKNSLKKVPLLKYWLEIPGSLYLDRDDARQAVTVMKQASEQLKNGLSMAIFPEGTRSRKAEPGEFHKGSLRPAFTSGRPILPVLIDGTYKLFEGNKGFTVKPAEVHLYFGKPIPTEGMPKSEQQELAANIGALIFSLKKAVP